MTKILIDEATVKLVLEALNSVFPRHLTPLISNARTALRKALAEQPAPLTWTFEDGLRPQDIRVEMYPPQPTSGMVVGMSKGVRLIHVPTGTTVSCDTERSQHRNREVAMKKLKAALADQPAQQEPLTGGDERRHIICLCPDCTKPAQPLTDEELANILPDDNTPMSLGEAFVKFARAIEAAHNIKENT